MYYSSQWDIICIRRALSSATIIMDVENPPVIAINDLDLMPLDGDKIMPATDQQSTLRRASLDQQSTLRRMSLVIKTTQVKSVICLTKH